MMKEILIKIKTNDNASSTKNDSRWFCLQQFQFIISFHLKQFTFKTISKVLNRFDNWNQVV